MKQNSNQSCKHSFIGWRSLGGELGEGVEAGPSLSGGSTQQGAGSLRAWARRHSVPALSKHQARGEPCREPDLRELQPRRTARREQIATVGAAVSEPWASPWLSQPWSPRQVWSPLCFLPRSPHSSCPPRSFTASVDGLGPHCAPVFLGQRGDVPSCPCPTMEGRVGAGPLHS